MQNEFEIKKIEADIKTAKYLTEGS
jgi:hypothetical protein